MHNRLDWSKNGLRTLPFPLQDGSEPSLFYEESEVLKHLLDDAEDFFYQSVEASAVLWADVCWGSRQRVMDANTLNKLIGRASRIVGGELDSLTVVSKRMLSKIDHAGQHLTLSTMCFTAIEAHSVTDSSHYRAPQEVAPVCGHKRILGCL